MELWRRADFTDRLFLVYFAGLAVLIFFLRDRVPGWPWYLLVHLVFILLIGLLVHNAQRFQTAHAWYPLAMPLFTFLEVAHLNFLLVDGWQDHYILSLEAWLFSEPPTVWLGRFASSLVTEVLQLGYFSYYFMLITVAGVLYRRKEKGPFFGVMAATILAYMLCYAVFIAFPTEGPAHTLRHLHDASLPGGPFHWLVNVVQKAGVHGNAFPSSHVAGVVAPLVFAWRYARRLAGWLTPLVILLCIGAVYDRYHYASDVIAGIAVGGSAALFVMYAQSRPTWERWLNIVPQRE